MTHKHAKMAAEMWAAVAQGESVEWRTIPLNLEIQRWQKIDEICVPSFDGNWEYEWRIVRPTITVNGIEVPAPETVVPENCETYWMPAPSMRGYCFSVVWTSDNDDRERLSRGLVYLTKEDAAACGRAMCPVRG